MIELAQHIEVLLLENDCVIVPGFGGLKPHILLLTNAKRWLPFLAIYNCHIRKNAYFCAT